ncbi:MULTISPECIES: hypothetical protein [Pantoea]|uniref:Uncharacterized protein n=1 Tax=Candidatus Pantoea gossypiicola TaxID=2608008 RepID=A0AB34CRR3_9GAMM|nr:MULTISPECIES: hypothetical protein [Pantoea]KAA5961013.1 hypothetical protein F3I55_00905 [Pantoea sp. VH_24]KAA5964448.1 hypothetical protein F3I53_01130 [Pantoea sp. VH_16]KAA5968615.1 hypothetical protein F3I54_01385 [Pantoea sp. VH_18]KAA6004317.1 hypothetical protein F3I46_00440 [Pantoea sp. M_1]KAA6006803.1 hypothetical protein F3I45_01105 [Pantoea sp. F_7]
MIEAAIKSELEAISGMPVYPLLLPDELQEGITFQRISDPEVEDGLVRTGLIAGRFQISMYRIDQYTDLVLLERKIWSAWRDIRHGYIGGYPVQYVERGNIVQDRATLTSKSIQYRLVRDFTLYFFEDTT